MLLADEESARAWTMRAFPDVSRETWHRIDRFSEMLKVEAARQNLVARATLANLWVRHIADSAQLALLAPWRPSRWLDLGTGAGFPGLIVAAVTGHVVTLVEPRKLRVEFLRLAADTLGIGERIRIAATPLDRLPTVEVDTISARAFAPLPRLLPLAHRFSTEKTRWILPKGRSAKSELEQVAATWHGHFRLEPSLTDSEARIIVADRVRPREQRRESV